jgi:hypothetical protein
MLISLKKHVIRGINREIDSLKGAHIPQETNLINNILLQTLRVCFVRWMEKA